MNKEETLILYRGTAKLVHAAQRDSSILKIAVQTKFENAQGKLNPLLINLNQKQPLPGIIEELCQSWHLSNPSTYALKFFDGQRHYITEKNRKELKDAAVLELVLSPTTICNNIVAAFVQPGASYEAKSSALQMLAEFASDPTFAQEFITLQGLALVINMIESNTFSSPSLTYLLTSFGELMEHSDTSWDTLSEKFVGEVANLVVGRSKTEDQKTLTAALSILESLVMNSVQNLSFAEECVPVETLLRHLDNSDQKVQLNALAVMNALFMKAPQSKKLHIAEILSSKPVRNSLVNSVFRASVGADMAHQLYILQTLLLNMFDERRLTKLSMTDAVDIERLHDLRRTAFETTVETTSPTAPRRQHQTSHARDFKKLGFVNPANPTEDFQEVPPGVLALDCMVYFAKEHSEAYTRLVLENSCRVDDHECPFAQTSIRLTKLLADILRIGQPPSEEGIVYVEMLFKLEQPFMEFFAVCIKLLNKTWREMHAVVDDIQKVMGVVQEQVTRSLHTRPPTLEKFEQEVNKLSYNEIQSLRQQERLLREETESQTRPIIELREDLKPEILALIKANRLNGLKEGKIFAKYSKGARSAREKGKFCFWKLSSNHKTFHFDDCDEKNIPSLEEMKNRLQVVDIKALLTGKDCPHIKDSRGKSIKASAGLAFSLLLNEANEGNPSATPDSSDACFNFLAPDEDTFNLWTDGVHALLNEPMSSKQAQADLDMLLSMEVKIRLLDLEGVDIPNSPPPIPPPPPNYDFCYELKA